MDLESAVEPPSELQQAGMEEPGRRSGSTGLMRRTVGAAAEKYKPVVLEAARASRAGEGSDLIIKFAVTSLVTGVLLVAALYAAEGPAEAGAGPLFNAGEDHDHDGEPDEPECNSVSIGPLLDDMQEAMNRTGWTKQQTIEWQEGLDLAIELQNKLRTLEALEFPPADGADGTGTGKLWWLGVAISCFACLANAFGYNLVRFSHRKVELRKAAGDAGAKSTDHWQFILGWFCSIVLCGFLDIYAQSFTAPELIAPLSGLTLVLNVWVAQLINHEKVVPLDYAVTFLILSGVIITIINGPQEFEPVVDSDYVWEQYFRNGWLFYEITMVGTALLAQYWCGLVYGDQTEAGIAAGRKAYPRLSQYSVLLFPWCGAIGTAHMNVGIRTLLLYWKNVGFVDTFMDVAGWFVAVGCISATLWQLRAINDGLRTEGALNFVPIKSAFNTAQVSLASCIFFQTLDSMAPLQACRYFIGLFVVIIGVSCITLRPDTEIPASAAVHGAGGLGESLAPGPELSDPEAVVQTDNQLHGAAAGPAPTISSDVETI
eukprot:COSAG02_NODE_983_length_15470_cov_4.269924_10_plen_543_part_00